MNFRTLATSTIAVLVLAAAANARYCNSPGCAMCNRMFGPIYQPAAPIAVPVAPAIESTPMVVVDAMLERLDITKNDLLCDVGCGDGRILRRAIERYNCRVVGIEIDPQVADRARNNLRLLNKPNHWKITTGDARKYTYPNVTVMTFYAFPDLMSSAIEKAPRLRAIASYSHPIPNHKTTKYLVNNNHEFYVWQKTVTRPVFRLVKGANLWRSDVD